LDRYKTKFNSEQLSKIHELFNENYGSRKIAQILNVNRSTIQRAYRQLGLDSKNHKVPRYVYKLTERICKNCKQLKQINEFRKRVKADRVSYESDCKVCEYKKNLNKAKLRSKRLRKEDFNFVIRRSVSHFIWKNLKNNNSNKNGHSCLEFLEYSIEDLKEHLEKQFESWMNWKNYGKYSKVWNDDQSTWTWQIDHIIPQSCLPYVSMEDDNFKKCWALSNLRPLSAKENHKDGVKRSRHLKVSG